MKFKLREGFSMQVDGGVLIGPCEVECDEATFKAHEHKLEACAPAEKPKKKKKAEAE